MANVAVGYCKGVGMSKSGLVNTMTSLCLFACLSGCAQQTRSADGATGEMPLGYDERITYSYSLIGSNEDEVCKHMLRVYNEKFRQPWNFRAYFRGVDPAAAAVYYGQSQRRLTENEQFRWYTRHAVYPTSPEFEEIKWAQRTLSGESKTYRRPLRFAHFDINNDGSADLVVQKEFFGFDDTRDSRDAFGLLDPEKIDLAPIELTGDERNRAERESINAGGVMRPFVFQKVVYLSHYQDEVGADESEMDRYARHIPPEKIWVKKYLGGQPVGRAMHATAICEFDMKWESDPIK